MVGRLGLKANMTAVVLQTSSVLIAYYCQEMKPTIPAPQWHEASFEHNRV
jgi:hypothetical protein